MFENNPNIISEVFKDKLIVPEQGINENNDGIEIKRKYNFDEKF